MTGLRVTLLKMETYFATAVVGRKLINEILDWKNPKVKDNVMQFFQRESSEGFEENRIESLTQRFITHLNK